MSEIVIKTFGLTKVYGMKKAVDNVALTVMRGDIYGFIGSNGAGKTTFIRMVMGLITPTAGSVELFGSAENLNEKRAKIGCIVETPALIMNMTAADCVNAQRLLYGLKTKEKIPELLSLVGLGDTGAKKVRDFSLGMKQRLAIAQALLNEPELLILDEPTNGMDPQGIVEIRKLLQKLVAEKGITILISSHILSELEQLATRFGIIENGVLIDEFTHEELEKKSIAKIILKVDDIEKAKKLLSKQFRPEQYTIFADNVLSINDQKDYTLANKLLVKNDVEVEFLLREQSGLEQYFISKVGI